ncbi:MAG: Proton-translocating NADH-quinone oxidoreductase subunit M, partial [Marinobacter sp. T13-3]
GALFGPDGREYVMMLSLLALVLLVGLYPQPLLDTTATLSQAVAELFSDGDLASLAGEVR